MCITRGEAESDELETDTTARRLTKVDMVLRNVLLEFALQAIMKR